MARGGASGEKRNPSGIMRRWKWFLNQDSQGLHSHLQHLPNASYDRACCAWPKLLAIEGDEASTAIAKVTFAILRHKRLKRQHLKVTSVTWGHINLVADTYMFSPRTDPGRRCSNFNVMWLTRLPKCKICKDFWYRQTHFVSLVRTGPQAINATAKNK